MTLTTRVDLTGPITADEAFDLALRAILRAAGETHRLESVITEREQRWDDGDYDFIGTMIGQGLPGITTAKGYLSGRQFGDPIPHHAEIMWDTVYGFHSRAWPTVEALHGAALIALHDTLPEDVSMRWRNEFTGEWFSCLGGLEDFMGSLLRRHAFKWLAVDEAGSKQR